MRSATVSYDLANTLGIQPVIGRNFLPEEDRKGGRKVALLGNALWQTKFNSSQDVIGKILQLDDEPYEVIGVLPKTAVFPADAAATRLLQTLLAGVSPHDPWAFLAVSIVLIIAALAANFIPARRAARIDPMHALRFE